MRTEPAILDTSKIKPWTMTRGFRFCRDIPPGYFHPQARSKNDRCTEDFGLLRFWARQAGWVGRVRVRVQGGVITGAPHVPASCQPRCLKQETTPRDVPGSVHPPRERTPGDDLCLDLRPSAVDSWGRSLGFPQCASWVISSLCRATP